jgi:hypothetical protein
MEVKFSCTPPKNIDICARKIGNAVSLAGLTRTCATFWSKVYPQSFVDGILLLLFNNVRESNIKNKFFNHFSVVLRRYRAPGAAGFLLRLRGEWRGWPGLLWNHISSFLGQWTVFGALV